MPLAFLLCSGQSPRSGRGRGWRGWLSRNPGYRETHPELGVWPACCPLDSIHHFLSSGWHSCIWKTKDLGHLGASISNWLESWLLTSNNARNDQWSLMLLEQPFMVQLPEKKTVMFSSFATLVGWPCFGGQQTCMSATPAPVPPVPLPARLLLRPLLCFSLHLPCTCAPSCCFF